MLGPDSAVPACQSLWPSPDRSGGRRERLARTLGAPVRTASGRSRIWPSANRRLGPPRAASGRACRRNQQPQCPVHGRVVRESSGEIRLNQYEVRPGARLPVVLSPDPAPQLREIAFGPQVVFNSRCRSLLLCKLLSLPARGLPRTDDPNPVSARAMSYKEHSLPTGISNRDFTLLPVGVVRVSESERARIEKHGGGLGERNTVPAQV